jgi:hypothetical protein
VLGFVCRDVFRNLQGRHVARDSCVSCLPSRVRAQDPGAPWPHSGAAQPSLRPILGNHAVNPDERWRRLDLVPSFCGGQGSRAASPSPASQRRAGPDATASRFRDGVPSRLDAGCGERRRRLGSVHRRRDR